MHNIIKLGKLLLHSLVVRDLLAKLVLTAMTVTDGLMISPMSIYHIVSNLINTLWAVTSSRGAFIKGEIFSKMCPENVNFQDSEGKKLNKVHINNGFS